MYWRYSFNSKKLKDLYEVNQYHFIWGGEEINQFNQIVGHHEFEMMRAADIHHGVAPSQFTTQ